MSRTEAAGRRRKRWACNSRDCDWVQPPRSQKPGACPKCGNTSLAKRWVAERAGRVDWPSVLEDIAARKIELRGANAEEAPIAYKRLPDVLAAHEGTMRVLHRLTPIGVAMAPGDMADPYKD